MQRSNGTLDVGNDVILPSLSNEELLDAFNHLGNQLSFLWNTFLKFHRYEHAFISPFIYTSSCPFF